MLPLIAAVGAVAIAWGVSHVVSRSTNIHNRIGCIDGLRGYLALAVMLSHFPIALVYHSTSRWDHVEIPVLKDAGKVAVTFFFMITALLFYTKVCIGVVKVNWYNLVISRISRIYPAFIVTLLCLLVAAYFYGIPKRDHSLEYYGYEVFRWLTFTDFQHTSLLGYDDAYVMIAGVNWTLLYEAVFYLSLPVVFFVFRRSESRIQRSAIIALTFLSGYLFRNFEGHRITDAIQAFSLGCAVAEIINAGLHRRFKFDHPWYSALIVALLISVFFLEVRFVYDMIAIALVLAIIAGGNSMFSTLSSQGSIALGDSSYSIYLLHGIVINLSLKAFAPYTGDGGFAWVLLVPISIVITLVAFCSYRFIELPGVAVGKRLAGWRSNRLTAIEVSAP